MRPSRVTLADDATAPAGQSREPRSQGSALVLQKKALCSVPRSLTYIRWLGGATLSVHGVAGSRSCQLAFARGIGAIAASYPFRAISLIAVGSTGRRPPLPQPVPLATDRLRPNPDTSSATDIHGLKILRSCME
jgi:hypothetical protein